MLEPTRIIAIRHGETAWNVATRIQGQLNVPLNDTGQWQAHRVALALAEEDISAIYASDLLRAYETATAISHGVGVPVQTDEGLRERGFGEFEGKTFAEIAALWPDQSLRWQQRDPDFAPNAGESLIQFRARVLQTTQTLAAQNAGKQIILVSHGGVMDVLYRAAMHLGLQAARTWQLGNAVINRLLWTPEGFSLVGWADSFHLDESPSLDDSTG